jgi:hypothetical protein
MNTRLITLSLAILGAVPFVPSAHAQRHFSFASAPATRFHARHAHRSFGGSAYAPYYYSDYDSEPGYVEAPPPPAFLQTALPPPPVPNPPQSLVLELNGDHWVRLTNYGESQTVGPLAQPESERTLNLQPGAPFVTPRRSATAEPVSPLPAAVLVFRDGHKEEIGKYTIVGKTIYTSADYWTSGSWTRKVQIAELDVPATLKLNQERGARFSLPSGPNEVMTRP